MMEGLVLFMYNFQNSVNRIIPNPAGTDKTFVIVACPMIPPADAQQATAYQAVACLFFMLFLN